MTYKYYEVRREMYEKNPLTKMSTFRSISDITKIYKRSFLILLGITVIALISIGILIRVDPNNPILLLLMIIVIINMGLSTIPREKYFYNKSARSVELFKKNEEYESCILEVWNILLNQGIDNDDKIFKLKNECENKLKIYEDKFTKINVIIADMLIGAPIGALIASIIKSDSEVAPMTIALIIFGGVAFLGLLKLYYLISFYFEGYFKDKLLLMSINELDYFNK